MIINGIEYYVAIFTTGADGNPEYEAHFVDFHLLNAFIRNNADNPKYLSCQMCYSFVEAIDSEPNDLSWTQDFPWCEFSDEQIQIEIDEFVEMEKEQEIFGEKVDEFSKEIHYRASEKDYRKKQHRLKDLAYVCPSCIRYVEECRCAGYPYYLVQIDKLMVPIIRELNSKGYKTTGCCAGHPEEDEFRNTGVYIAFAEEYDFDEPFPTGGKYSKKKHLISYAPTVEGYENLVDFQKKILRDLEDWTEMLFDVDYGLDEDKD